jgi:hypothetical protein
MWGDVQGECEGAFGFMKKIIRKVIALKAYNIVSF